MKEQNNICSKDTLAKQLVEKIKAALPQRNVMAERICRFEVEVDGLVPLDWLCIQKNHPKTYWSDREKNFETAGVGATQILRDDSSLCLADALRKIEDNLTSATGTIRYYGGICFDQDDRLPASWQQFGLFYFIVPEFELCRENNRLVFAFNIVYEPGCPRERIIKKLLSALNELNFNDESACKPFTAGVLSRTDCPDKSKWKENILRAVDTLRLKNIKKIVLSRKSVFHASQPVNPIVLLKQVKNNSIGTYDFCFQLNVSNAFLGCTPECLYRKNKNSIYSEAIAGTCLAGKTDIEQRGFQEELLNSPKEAEEHKYVFDGVKSDLNELCSEVYVLNQRDIMSLSYVQHFCSRFRGILKDNINTQKIIETLHPTAAVHGYPKREVKKEIKKYEPFSRGWYAGPVGWIGQDCAEFAVAIRSGLVQGNKISLFAGAGIVKASDPVSEWNETENKLRQFLEVIG